MLFTYIMSQSLTVDVSHSSSENEYPKHTSQHHVTVHLAVITFPGIFSPKLNTHKEEVV